MYVAGSFDEAINMLTSVPLLHKVDKLFVIGGSSVYKVSGESTSGNLLMLIMFVCVKCGQDSIVHCGFQTALQSLLCQRIYLTRVLGDFECDTFLPEFDMSIFKQIK